jgi:hypothetical protein
MSERRKADPNATIQLDALEPGELEDAAAASVPREVSVSGARKGPPPLPLRPLPEAQPAAVRTGKKVGYVALLVFLLAAAIAGGLLVGARVRPTATAPVVPAPTHAAPSASAAPTTRETLTLPTIEMK